MLEKTPPEKAKIADAGGSGGDGNPPSDNLALIRELLRHLPVKKEEMTNDKLRQWLRAAETNLRLIYEVDGEIRIEAVKESNS